MPGFTEDNKAVGDKLKKRNIRSADQGIPGGSEHPIRDISGKQLSLP
jgi:hypothetical protein